MLLTYYTWIKAVKTGTVLWGTLSALAYFYMVSILKTNRQIHVNESIFLLGVVLGWLCFSHQLNTSSCFNADGNRKVYSSYIRRI